MAKLIRLSSGNKAPKALKKASRQRSAMEAAGQLNMFAEQRASRTVSIDSAADPFLLALQLEEQNSPRAAEYYELAIARDVRKVDALINVATIYADSGRNLEAMDRLAKALVLAPDNAVAHYNIANVYLEVHNTSLSRLHYEMALQIDPNMSDALFNLALVCLLSSDRERAVALLERYKESHPEQADIAELLGAMGLE